MKPFYPIPLRSPFLAGLRVALLAYVLALVLTGVMSGLLSFRSLPGVVGRTVWDDAFDVLAAPILAPLAAVTTDDIAWAQRELETLGLRADEQALP